MKFTAAQLRQQAEQAQLRREQERDQRAQRAHLRDERAQQLDQEAVSEEDSGSEFYEDATDPQEPLGATGLQVGNETNMAREANDAGAQAN